LLRAASKLFCKRGLEGTSIDEVAEAAGYTKGAFYANFKSKEELFLVMLDERFAKELERIDRTLSGTDDPETEARLAAAEFIHFASDDDWPRLYFQFAAHAARNEEFRQELATRQQAMRERLVEVYERWTKQFEIDPPLPIADVVSGIRRAAGSLAGTNGRQAANAIRNADAGHSAATGATYTSG